MKQSKGIHVEEWYECQCPRQIDYPQAVPRKRSRICDKVDCWKVRKLRESKGQSDPRILCYMHKLGFERVMVEYPQAITRLQLVLDLENTLVETVKEEADLPPLVRSAIEKISFRLPGMLVSKRQGLEAFLGLVSKYYDLWLHAAGAADYIASVLKVIDPADTYFPGRVFSSDVSMRNQPKKLSALPNFPPKKDLTLILDDQSELWQTETCVIPSKIFTPSGQISIHNNVDLSTLSKKFSFSGVKAGEMLADGSDTQLEHLMEALIRTHQRFVERKERHTAAFEFSEVRKEVLSREVLSFEGYKQKREVEAGYSDERYRLYHFAAAALGASEQLEGRKVEENAHDDVVSGAWLFQCFLHCHKL